MSKRFKDENGEHSKPANASNADAVAPEIEALAEAAIDAEPSAEELQDSKDKEIAELKDKYLRALAEGENQRRRIRQQSEESVRLQRENLLRDLLPIVDNLQRAVEAARAGGEPTSIVEGVELVLASLMDYLKANGVRPQTSVGEQFDPSRHEAVDHVRSDEHPPNTVVSEFHRGYMMGERVLRPARVVVAKGNGAS